MNETSMHIYKFIEMNLEVGGNSIQKYDTLSKNFQLRFHDLHKQNP